MSQTSSREQQQLQSQQQQQQQQQQQKQKQQKRIRIRTAAGTSTNQATISTEGAASAIRTRTRTASTISSSRNSSPAPSSRAASSLSLTSSVANLSTHHNHDEQPPLVNNDGNHTSTIEGTSLLGSVWNLFRDVKDLASKEIDKLLEHFPYNSNTSRVIVTTNHDDLQDRLLSTKKRQGVLAASLSSASLPRKSLLGHGPSQKRRTGTAQGNQAVLSKRLLDEDLRTQVNDVSSRKIPAAPSSVMSGVSSESRRVVPARSRSVSTVSESGSRHSNARRQLSLATPRPTPTPPLLKRDSSISTVLYRSSQDTEADWSSAVSHIDEVESDSSQSRMSAMRSRESSMTPPITSMAQAMYISSRGQALQRPQRREQSAEYDTPKRNIKQSTAQLHRRSSSLSGSDLTRDEPDRQQHQQKYNRDNNPEAPIYPQTLTSRSRIQSENRTQARVVDDSPPAAFTDSVNNPFIASSGKPSPAQESRTPSPSSNIDNASFTALVQQVTAMREQLASLLAEKEIHQRTYSAPASLSPGAPPPPPPPPLFPQTPSSKMRTPPVNEATRSMAMVLNELSTSKVHLRKTDSPFLSRISSAIDSSPNSRFSRVVFRSRLDMISDKYSGNSTTGSTAPLSLVGHLRGPNNRTSLNGSASQPLDRMPLETPVKRGIQPIFQEPEEEEEEELSWPSPGTVRQADSRLEVAAKSLSQKQYGKEQAAVLSRSSGGLETKRAEDKADYGTPKAHNLVEGKRKWKSRTSYTTETEIGEVTLAAGANIANAGAESEEVTLSSGGLSLESGVFGRERSGPRLDDNNKRPRRPARPRSMVLSRSMTDPTTLHSSRGVSTATPTMTIADKEKERQWFLESDMDGWKVAN